MQSVAFVFMFLFVGVPWLMCLKGGRLMYRRLEGLYSSKKKLGEQSVS